MVEECKIHIKHCSFVLFSAEPFLYQGGGGEGIKSNPLRFSSITLDRNKF